MTTSVSDVRERQARFVRSMSEEERQGATTNLRSLGHDMSRASVMQFQRTEQIKVDGIIGPQTKGALERKLQARDQSVIDPNLRREGPPRAPTIQDQRTRPEGMTPARDLQARDTERRVANATGNQKFDYYASIIRANGGVVNPNGRASVLGVRERDGVTHKFEDKIVVLSPNGQVSEFAGSTRPSNVTAAKGGVAELVPGNYNVVPHQLHYGRPSYQVLNQNNRDGLPVYRDRNMDGNFSAREKANPINNGTGILFHVPNPRYADSTPTSIGCINIPNRDWNRFMGAVGGSRASFNFTLVDR